MNIQYEPRLMEEVVFQEVKRREQAGDFSLFEAYHELADPIYENFSDDKREAEFEKLNNQFFLKLGFGEVIAKGIEEFPMAGSKVEAAIVGKAITEGEEGADISKNLRFIGIKLRPERFLTHPYPEGGGDYKLLHLRRYLRHELMHVSDMLDEKFEYRRELTVASLIENVIRDRYKVIWDIYIDSRLLREGKETVSDRDGRYHQFQRLYRKIPPLKQRAVFDSLWQAEELTHSRILEMAKDTGKLLSFFGADLEADETDEEELPKKDLLLGSPCPLCNFPTYAWLTDPLPEKALEAIKKDYPDWKPEEGVCERCIEGYKVKVA